MTNTSPSEIFPLEQMLTRVDVANLLQVPVKTLARWRTTGTGPTCYTIGRHVRYSAADLSAWILRQQAT